MENILKQQLKAVRIIRRSKCYAERGNPERHGDKYNKRLAMTANKINVQVDYEGESVQIGLDTKFESEKRTEAKQAEKENSERSSALTDFVMQGTKVGEFMGKKSVGVVMMILDASPTGDGTNKTDELAVDIAINVSIEDGQTVQDIINMAVNELNSYQQKIQEIEKQKEDEKKE